MSNKIDLKKYQDKTRVYQAVKGTTGISRLLIWTGTEYLPPQSNSYLARRWERDRLGKKERFSRYFDSLKQAREWQSQLTPSCEADVIGLQPKIVTRLTPSCLPRSYGPTLNDVVDLWKKRRWPSLEDASVETYAKMIRLHFGFILDQPVTSITPDVIDSWLDDLIDHKDDFKKDVRFSFKRELRLLNTLLNYYVVSYRDSNFRSPILETHRDRAFLKNVAKTRERSLELNEVEFLVFREFLLENGPIGRLLYNMATIQFYQALRIQEAAALDWTSVLFGGEQCEDSLLRVFQRVIYLRNRKGKPCYIKKGLKNGPEKTLQMMPLTVKAILDQHSLSGKGLIFADPRTGKFFPYHDICNAYNRAFKRAGLPNKATHVMRHGGGSKVYNETGSDLEITKKALGNSSISSVMVYAKRDQKAYGEYVKKQWGST